MRKVGNNMEINLDDSCYNINRIIDDISEDLEYSKYLDMESQLSELEDMEGYIDVESEEYWGTLFSSGDD